MKAPGTKLLVAVVEDNPTDLFLVRQALAYHEIDADLCWFRDGEEMIACVEKIEAGELPCPDVVLLDLNLPRHSGIAILTRLRHSAVCVDVPVIVVTSSLAAEDRDATLRLGATRYFHKSIDYDESMELGALVLDVTKGQRQ